MQERDLLLAELDIRKKADFLRTQIARDENKRANRKRQALLAVNRYIEDGYDPEDIGPNGRALYIEVARETGMSESEIYTLFRSPEQLGAAA